MDQSLLLCCLLLRQLNLLLLDNTDLLAETLAYGCQ